MKSIFKIMSIIMMVGIVLSSCKPQNCDNMYPGKLVYLKKPYKTVCPYNNKEYKIYAHLYMDIWNNTKVGVVRNIPKEYRVYDTTCVLVSFTDVPPLHDMPGFKNGISAKTIDTLPTEFVILNCIAKSN